MFVTEDSMRVPLYAWLKATRMVGDSTRIFEEVRWFDRRVDCVTINGRRVTTAFELKLKDNVRAIEQASLNALAFDRSFVVTATPPGAALRDRARRSGVGIICSIEHGSFELLVPSCLGRPHESVRHELLRRLRLLPGKKG
jgi:hypothetical protein